MALHSLANPKNYLISLSGTITFLLGVSGVAVSLMLFQQSMELKHYNTISPELTYPLHSPHIP